MTPFVGISPGHGFAAHLLNAVDLNRQCATSGVVKPTLVRVLP